MNGLIVGKTESKLPFNKQKTYFGKIAILVGSVHVVVAPSGVNIGGVKHGWKVNWTYTDEDITVSTTHKDHIKVCYI